MMFSAIQFQALIGHAAILIENLVVMQFNCCAQPKVFWLGASVIVALDAHFFNGVTLNGVTLSKEDASKLNPLWRRTALS